MRVFTPRRPRGGGLRRANVDAYARCVCRSWVELGRGLRLLAALGVIVTAACGDDVGDTEDTDETVGETDDATDGESEGTSGETSEATGGESDAASDSDPSAGETAAEDDVPDNSYCGPVADWDAGWSALETEVLELVNAERAKGATCGGQPMPATTALTGDPALRCAARVHSKDMVDNDYFDHTNLDGEGPGPRIEKAGYSWATYGENIAGGSATAAAVVQQWMDSPGHCMNIMNADFEELGVGYYPGGQWGHTWTQVFARTF